MNQASQTAFIACGGALLLMASAAIGQRIAVISPDRSAESVSFAEDLTASLAKDAKVLDADLALAAYNSGTQMTPYNMQVGDAKLAATRIGCDFLILIRSRVPRRSSFARAQYYEGYAAIYTISGRTGRLIDWRLLSFDADSPDTARDRLHDGASQIAKDLENVFTIYSKRELNEPDPTPLPEPPDDKTPPDPAFRSPLPYRRLKPEYTEQANLYSVTATVEITVDLDAAGQITRTEITRWAGYGLDEAVEKAVRSMSWRPADRNGKPLAMRFTLQYNFKKVEKS